MAYEIYLEKGSEEGHDIENWLNAERIVLSRLESDKAREEQIGKLPAITEMHVIEPTSDTVTA